MGYNQLFLNQNYAPLPDKELCQIFDQARVFMTDEEFKLCLTLLVEKYGQEPTRVMHSMPGRFQISDQEDVVYWYHLRNDFKTFAPFYKAAAKNQLTDEQSTELLFAVMHSSQYDFIRPVDSIVPLTAALEAACDRGFSFKDVVPDIYETLAVLKKNADPGSGMAVLEKSIQAGIPPKQSLELIEGVCLKSSIAGYVLNTLYCVLESLSANELDGQVLSKALQVVMGRNPYYSQGDLKDFVIFLEAAVTTTKFSQKEIVQEIVDLADVNVLPDQQKNAQIGTLEKVVQDVLPISTDKSKGSVVVLKGVNEYFPKISSKKLLVGALPYRLNKNFEDGIADLKKLVWKTDHEGSFIFDPWTDTWFSLGGQTRLVRGGMRHEFHHYDIAQLSRAPIHVHMHPYKSEIFVSPPADVLAYPQYQKRLTKFQTVMPSGADYKAWANFMRESSSEICLQSSIVTSMGVTEIDLPANPQAVEELGQRFRDLKDEVVLEYDYRSCTLEDEGTEAKFIQLLLPAVNEKLPAGFSINIKL